MCQVKSTCVDSTCAHVIQIDHERLGAIDALITSIWFTLLVSLKGVCGASTQWLQRVFHKIWMTCIRAYLTSYDTRFVLEVRQSEWIPLEVVSKDLKRHRAIGHEWNAIFSTPSLTCKFSYSVGGVWVPRPSGCLCS